MPQWIEIIIVKVIRVFGNAILYPKYYIQCQNPYEQIAAQFIVQTMRIKVNSCSGNISAIARAGNYFFLLNIDFMFISLE